MGIAARSTNVKGFVHYGGDVVSGVEDGIGIIVGSASTGSTPYIEPIADGTTAALGIRAKGAAKLTLGNSSNTVDLIGNSTITGGISVSGDSTFAGNVTLGGGVSTGTKLAIKGVYSSTWSGELAALSSGQQAEVTLTTAVGVIWPGDLYCVDFVGRTISSGLALIQTRLSTVATSVVTLTFGNIASTAFAGTNSVAGTITWIDLT